MKITDNECIEGYVFSVSSIANYIPNIGSWLPYHVVKDHFIKGHDMGVWRIKHEIK